MPSTEPIHPNAETVLSLMDTPEKRNALDTAAKCQGLIDALEETVPHDRLPMGYDWLVERRNGFTARAAHGGG